MYVTMTVLHHPPCILCRFLTYEVSSLDGSGLTLGTSASAIESRRVLQQVPVTNVLSRFLAWCSTKIMWHTSSGVPFRVPWWKLTQSTSTWTSVYSLGQDSDEGKKKLLSNSKINKQLCKSKISMGKNLLIKIKMSKSPNEMGNCPFDSPLNTPLIVINSIYNVFPNKFKFYTNSLLWYQKNTIDK